MKNIRIIPIVLTLAFFPGTSRAAGAAAYLDFLPSARAAAMGGAASAVPPTDAAAAQANPALMVLFDRPVLSASNGSLALNRNLNYAGLVWPADWSGGSWIFNENISSPSGGNRSGRWFVPQKKVRFAIYAGGTLFDVNDIERRSEFGVPLGSFDNSERSLDLGLAGRLYRNLSLGISTRFLRQSLADATAEGNALTTGLWYRVEVVRRGYLDTGAGVRDMAGSLKWNVPDPDLPRTAKYKEDISRKLFVGIRWSNLNQRWTLAADALKPSEESTRAQMGFEWKAAPSLALRTGWNDGDPSAGAGFSFQRFSLVFSLDYAFVYDTDALANPQWLTLSAHFGGSSLRGYDEEEVNAPPMAPPPSTPASRRRLQDLQSK